MSEASLFLLSRAYYVKQDFIRLCGKKKKTQKIIKIQLTYNVKFYIFCKVYKKLRSSYAKGEAERHRTQDY